MRSVDWMLISWLVRHGYESLCVFLGTAKHYLCSMLSNGSENASLESPSAHVGAERFHMHVPMQENISARKLGHGKLG